MAPIETPSWEDSCPEHPTFHKRTMRGAAGIVLLLLVLAGLSGYAAHLGIGESWLPRSTFIAVSACILWLVGYLSYRAVLARPDCPQCGKRLEWFGFSREIKRCNWRFYHCGSCGHRFRIQGLSSSD